MRAVAVPRLGPIGKIVIKDFPIPVCGPDDVLIKVVSAGVNPVDWKESEGALEQFFGQYPDFWVPGLDAAGVVQTTGKAVSNFRQGDRVVAISDRARGHSGTFAEYVRVPECLVAKVPPSISLDEAASIPCAGLTGFQALFRAGKGRLGHGDAVFIHGGSGGVGSWTVQSAKARGLRVAASCSAANVDYVRSLGADIALDHATGELVQRIRQWQPDGVAAVIDCVSGETLPDALDMLRPGGRLISIPTLTQDGDVEGDTALAKQRGFSKIMAFVEYDKVGEELAEILDMMVRRAVQCPPLTIYPFSAAAAAIERMKVGKVRGKIILRIADDIPTKAPT